MEERTGLTGSTLKIIALISMVLDHISRIVLTNGIMMRATYGQISNSQWSILENVADVTFTLGRIAFPIFCFLIVEGFVHTHSLFKYMLTMLGFAFLSEGVYDYVCSGSIFSIEQQNVMFEFLLALVMLFLLRQLQKIPKLPKVPEIIGDLLVVFLFSVLSERFYLDGGMYGILLIAVFYFFRSYKKTRFVAVVLVLLISACHIVRGGFVFNWDNILDLTVAAEIVSLIPISFYNGKRGLRQKYFFYVFYPFHLLLLYGCMLLIMRML